MQFQRRASALASLVVLLCTSANVQALDFNYPQPGFEPALSGRNLNSLWDAQYFQARDLTDLTYNNYNPLYSREAEAEALKATLVRRIPTPVSPS